MMTYQKRSFLVIVCWIGALSFLTSCYSFVADREQGFNMIQRGFSNLESSPDLHEEIELRNIKVIIVGEREQFTWEKAAAANSSIIGYATPSNEIWIFGKMVEGKIVLNEAVLGHELTHLLNFKNPKIANPDKFRDLNKLNALKFKRK
jgi:hypothetical protein